MTNNTMQHDCADQGCLAAMLGVELASTDEAETD
jgi:hypothetical protein